MGHAVKYHNDTLHIKMKFNSKLSQRCKDEIEIVLGILKIVSGCQHEFSWWCRDN